MKPLNRRTFIGASVIAAGVASRPASGNPPPAPGSRPIVISSANGLLATERAAQTIQRGGSPVDAVVAGVNIVEERVLAATERHISLDASTVKSH